MTKRSKVLNDMYGKVSNPAVTYERFLVVDLFRSITKTGGYFRNGKNHYISEIVRNILEKLNEKGGGTPDEQDE